MIEGPGAFQKRKVEVIKGREIEGDCVRTRLCEMEKGR